MSLTPARYGKKSKRNKKQKVAEKVEIVALEFSVSDTAEALEQDYMNIGYSPEEARRAAKNVFEYDSK